MTLWTHEDAPEQHPLWETQVELERGMMRAGADKVRDAVLEAESRDQMTRTAPVRHLITDWLPGVADAIRSWVKDVEKSRGVKPIALPYVKEMDPYVAGLIALRAVLNGVAQQRQKLTGLAMEIGRTCEHEQRVRLWEAKEPALYYHYADEMDRNRATATHRRRVNINRFNTLVKDAEIALEWDDWSQEVHFRVGVALLDCIIRKTGWFELQPDPGHVFSTKGRYKGPQLVVAIREGLTQWLAKAMDHAEVNSPEFQPMIMPPRRWGESHNFEGGGYYTPYVRTPRLVRFKASQESQKEHAADEYDALDMPHVYDALHLLQETAWRVNKRVLEVAKTVWAKSKDGGVAGLPQISERDFPPRTPRMVEHGERILEWKQNGRKGPRPKPDEETDAEVLAWKKQASPIYRFNAKRVSKLKATSNTILIAEQYADYAAIYFPHMLDFRGRFYPIPAFLQPQGSDLARGLLTFAEGLPITEENGGGPWLAIHLAACCGIDKVSLDERITWVEEHEDQWRRIAEDPYANTEWHQADKPFQALAAIFEWVAFLDHGWGYVSSLPVMVDGTCNGIQHLSAILRDEVAGRYVNLVPADKPQDIYKYVAVELQETLERIERVGGLEGEKATYWLDLTNRDLPRTLTKRQVMVLPYGGTKDSFFTYTREWLDESDPLPTEADEGKRLLRTGRIVFMANRMWDTVNHVVTGGMRVMEWLQKCAKVVAVANQPIYWTVPSGFTVRHFYGLNRAVVHKLFLDGERVEITRNERTAQLSTKEQAQGIAPNFIHSLDASCLVDCLKRCREAGIEEFAAVHDAYGTHAANMNALSVFLREAFVATHAVDVLGNFRAACQRVLVDWLVVEKGMEVLEASEKADAMLPPMLEKGGLDLAGIMESEYFFH